MPPVLVPVPPWIAMKQPLVEHGTRAKRSAADMAAVNMTPTDTAAVNMTPTDTEAVNMTPTDTEQPVLVAEGSMHGNAAVQNEEGTTRVVNEQSHENSNDDNSSPGPSVPPTPRKDGTHTTNNGSHTTNDGSYTTNDGSHTPTEEATIQVLAVGHAWCLLKGHFPLAGTYFQHNEVFIDTSSVLFPIRVGRGCVLGTW